MPGSHYGKGWETFTDVIINNIVKLKQPVIFMLWGKHAQQKEDLIYPYGGESHHYVLKCRHPSPLSANMGPVHERFFGCGHFARVNQILASNKQATIDWSRIDDDGIPF